jgi:hypothetical protein
VNRPITKSEKRDLIAKLTAYKQALTRGEFCGQVDYSIKDRIQWFNEVFFKLPEMERSECRKDWDNYYKTSWGKGVVKPSGFDPMEWDNCDWALAFRHAERRLKDLQSPEEEEWQQQTGGSW